MVDNTDKMYEACGELEKFAEMEGTEWGETAARLVAMYYGRTLLSDELVAVLEKEILDWLADVKENAHIVEREETRTYKIVDLEWYT